jgi:hypothetical protein
VVRQELQVQVELAVHQEVVELQVQVGHQVHQALQGQVGLAVHQEVVELQVQVVLVVVQEYQVLREHQEVVEPQVLQELQLQLVELQTT